MLINLNSNVPYNEKSCKCVGDIRVMELRSFDRLLWSCMCNNLQLDNGYYLAGHCAHSEHDIVNMTHTCNDIRLIILAQAIIR